MNRSCVYLGGLVGTLLALGAVHAQNIAPPVVAHPGHGKAHHQSIPTPPPHPPKPPPAYATTPEQQTAPTDNVGPEWEPYPGPSATPEGGGPDRLPYPAQGLSRYLIYPRTPGCCGPMGGDGPIGSELFVRSGAAFLFNTSQLSSALGNGWVIEGGGRLLFFDPEVRNAWTFAMSVSNVNYNDRRTVPVTLFNVTVSQGGLQGGTNTIPVAVPTINGLNQTFVNIGIGREWFLWAPAYHYHNAAQARFPGHCDPHNNRNLRVGVEGGGRYGSAKITYNELPHMDDVIGGFYVAASADLEFPCGGFIFQAGLRTEYSYIWSDILQRQNSADTQTLNLLVTTGIRY